MDKTVKVGIIGVGNMGSVYIGFFGGTVRGAVISAIADCDELKLAAAKRALGDVSCYDSGEELIKSADVDAVIIATPHYSHPSLAIAAFKRGLHVLVEKPSGVYAKQVKEMNEAAVGSGKVFGIMLNQRALPLHKTIKNAMMSGAVGELKRVNWVVTNWYRTQFYYDSGDWRATWRGEGGGVLINQALHQLDLLQWFTGMPVSVRAFCGFGRWHDIEVEDDVTAYLRYGNGATATFITSTGEPHGVNRLEITGTRGTLLCENGVLTLNKFSCDEREFCRSCKNAFGEPAAEKTELMRHSGAFDRHTEILQNFICAVRGEEELYARGEDGLNSVILLNAMLLSAWRGSEINLPFSDSEYLAELNKRADGSRLKRAERGLIIDNRGSFGGI